MMQLSLLQVLLSCLMCLSGAEVSFPCNEDGVRQDLVPDIAFTDYGDNPNVVASGGELSSSGGFMIDASNSHDFWRDTARYRRSDNYEPASQLTWHVPNGFNSFWAQVYYSLNDFAELGSMRYELSMNGKRWSDASAVTADQDISRSAPVSTSTAPGSDEFWFMRREIASFPFQYHYFRAIFPPACPSESADLHARCNTNPDAAARYFAPQIGELLLQNTANTQPEVPSRPQHIRMSAAYNSISLVWEPPHFGNASGYIVFYQKAAAANVSTPSPFAHRNTGTRRSIKLMNLEPDTTYVFRIAALTEHGAGLRSFAQWISTSSSAAALEPLCPPELPQAWNREADWVPPGRGEGFSPLNYSIHMHDAVLDIHMPDASSRCGFLDVYRPKSFWPCAVDSCCSESGSCGTGIHFCNEKQQYTPVGALVLPPSPSPPTMAPAKVLLLSPMRPSVLFSGQPSIISWKSYPLSSGRSLSSIKVEARIVGGETVGVSSLADSSISFVLPSFEPTSIQLELVSDKRVLGTTDTLRVLPSRASENVCESCLSSQSVWENMHSIPALASLVKAVRVHPDIVASLNSSQIGKAVFLPNVDALTAESIEAVLDDIRSGYSFSNSPALMNVNSLLPISTSVVDTLCQAKLGDRSFQRIGIRMREDRAVVLNEDAIVLMADVPCSNAVLQVLSAPVHGAVTLDSVLVIDGNEGAEQKKLVEIQNDSTDYASAAVVSAPAHLLLPAFMCIVFAQFILG